jgi:hypothetical protein
MTDNHIAWDLAASRQVVENKTSACIP